MLLNIHRQRAIRQLVLCCAALLFAAQTVALTHVHADDTTCVVCPHTVSQIAAVDAAAPADATPHSLGLVPISAAPGVTGEHRCSFEARAPPTFDH
jgi:hypothetical protein